MGKESKELDAAERPIQSPPNKKSNQHRSRVLSPATDRHTRSAETESRYDRFLNRIKDHPALVPFLVIGTALIVLATVMGSIEQISTYFLKENARGASPVSMVITDTERLRVDFSIVNSAKTRQLTLTGVWAVEIIRVDICRTCSIMERLPLVLDLESDVEQSRWWRDEFHWKNERLFGKFSVIDLAPGETAPFALTVSAPSNVGIVFRVELGLIDVEEATGFRVIPPYLFYVGGPIEYPKSFLKVVSIEDWVHDPDPYLRENIARAVGVLGDERAKEALIHSALNEPDPGARGAALVALGSFPGRRSLQILQEALAGETWNGSFTEDGREELRRSAAVGLGRLKDQRALQPLYQAWSRDSGFWVANEAMEAIGQIGGGTALSIIKRALNSFDQRGGKDHQNRSSIIKALAHHGGEEALELLYENLYYRTEQGRNIHAHSYAAWGLRSAKAKYVKRILGRLEIEKDPELRILAIQALMRMQAEGALSTLKRIAEKDASPRVREVAQEAVQRLLNIIEEKASATEAAGKGE